MEIIAQGVYPSLWINDISSDGNKKKINIEMNNFFYIFFLIFIIILFLKKILYRLC